MKKYLSLYFLVIGAITFLLLYRHAKSINIFVPKTFLIENLIVSFVVYLLVIGLLFYFLILKIQNVYFRFGLISIFYIIYYYLFLIRSTPLINGFAP
jgi:hypothetical protein